MITWTIPLSKYPDTYNGQPLCYAGLAEEVGRAAMFKVFGTALRSLRRAPAFTGLVVLTLALGIGATTAMFSVVDAVLLNPLPYPNADRFSEIWRVTAPAGSRRPGGSVAIIQALREQTEVFSAVEAYQFGSANITGGGDPLLVTAPSISPGLLLLLSARPLLGRLFTQEDAAAGGVVMLDERLWASRFGSDPAIVGREITVDDRPHRVVGVLPSRFRFPGGNIEIWRPLDVSATAKPAPVQVVVTRRAGVSAGEANDRLQGLTTSLRERAAITKDQSLTTAYLLQQRFGRQTGQSLYLMFGAVALVLLVACVNVTNLLLVRASTRQGELAVMTALGAGRGTLMRAVLLESLVLAVAGCVVGVLLARALLSLILGMAPPQLTFLTGASTELDWRGLAFAASVASATCLVVGLLPAWRTARVDAIDAIKQRPSGVIGSRDDWWQGALVASQLALVLVLLAGSGLLLRSFARLVDVDPGFEVDRSAVISLQLPASRYSTPGAGLAFMQELERKVESAPGIAATISGGVPPTGGGFYFEIAPEAEGVGGVDVGKLELPYSTVASDYFETMGIPIRQGRSFEPGDPADVVIVNDLLARRIWGDTSPVGRRFRLDPDAAWWTVVGVAADVKSMGPSDPMGEGMEFYRPFASDTRNNFFALVVRVPGDPAAMLPMLKQRVWELDPKQPVYEAETMSQRMSEAVMRPRFFMNLASAFAVTATLLAAIGVYGVAAYWVSRRRRELAIRVALGATRWQLMSMVVGRCARLAAVGCATGLGLALWGARAIESMLFQVSARDPLTFVVVTALLGVLALLAVTGPALNASRVDPMSVLRAE